MSQKLYETACNLARGFDCGNCTARTATKWRCQEDGCCSLRDGIYEELRAAANRGCGDVMTPAEKTGLRILQRLLANYDTDRTNITRLGKNT